MRYLICVALCFSSITSWANSAVFDAAKKHASQMSWQTTSAQIGDFNCKGRKQHAIMATTASNISVAVFLDGLDKKPVILKFDVGSRQPEFVKLTIESLDGNANEFKEMLGSVPSGLRFSKICKGLNLSDDRVDTLHIYWNHKVKRFDFWSL